MDIYAKFRNDAVCSVSFMLFTVFKLTYSVLRIVNQMLYFLK